MGIFNFDDFLFGVISLAMFAPQETEQTAPQRQTQETPTKPRKGVMTNTDAPNAEYDAKAKAIYVNAKKLLEEGIGLKKLRDVVIQRRNEQAISACIKKAKKITAKAEELNNQLTELPMHYVAIANVISRAKQCGNCSRWAEEQCQYGLAELADAKATFTK